MYQWGEGGAGYGERSKRHQLLVENDLHGYIIQHGECSQHIIITINRVNL